jgi:hypothetical protein
MCAFIAVLYVCVSKCLSQLVPCCSKVFLGYKKSNPDQMCAIKVMKKSEMVNKNMASQGDCNTECRYAGLGV